MSKVKGKHASCKGEGSKQSSKMERRDIETAKKYLINEDSEWLGIQIWGESGSGKTTLARSWYDDFDVSHHFHMRAWFTVGTICKVRDILESLYYTLTSASETEIKKMSWKKLPNEVSKELVNKKRWLIVLDDVCSSNNIWEDGLHSVFEGKKYTQGRIIITTRLTDLEGYKPKYKYKMELLEKKEKWELFKQGSKVQDEALKSIVRDIIKTSDGLPLAILLVAHTLGSNKSIDFWKDCRRQMERMSLSTAVALSCDKLPQQLQQCFNYLRQFPTDKVISAEKLCLLWMAEGMIEPRTLKKATQYYKELRDRKLVIEVERGDVSASSQWFALCKAIPSIHNDDSVLHDHSHNTSAKRIKQSLFFAETKQTAGSSKDPNKLSSKDYKNLRALDYNGVELAEEKFLQVENELKDLKYLSFQGCSLTELPELIRKIASLETLDLRAEDSCCMCIPDVLWKLSKLRHLYFPRAFKTKEGPRASKKGKNPSAFNRGKNPSTSTDKNDKIKLQLKGLDDLEILENFHAGECKSDDLESLTKLRSLRCIVVETIKDLENILKAIQKKNEDFRMSLVVKNIKTYSPANKKTVEKMFSCSHIQILHIQDCYLELGGPHGSKFTEMVLDKAEFGHEHLLSGKHPNLKSLVLRNNAFPKKKMVFQGKDFPELTSLKLEKLESLEEFEVNKAVPLAVLTISNCAKLEKLPVRELAEMKTLKKLITRGGFKSEVELINEFRQEKKYIALTTA